MSTEHLFLKQLQNKIVASPYLSLLQEQHELELKEVTPQQLEQKMTSICDAVEHYDVSEHLDLDEAASLLKSYKAQFVFAWSQAALVGYVSQAELGQWQTRFAEVTIELALRIAWQQQAKKNAAIKSALTQNNAVMPGLFIFGMGKLGGQDLNFSSDVDLVAYFDPDLLPVPDAIGKAYVCHQVLQTMTMLLNQQGQLDFIWRVDWRLRPDASATTLAMSTYAAEEYYFYRASPWHRLALMKARVIAGDLVTGDVFLTTLAPFIWRQNLDFRALDELAEIKQRINLEHPALKAQRQWRDPIVNEVAGFNVKLGSGGIREVEFVANALQLIWGGKHYPLRIANTLKALDALVSFELLDAKAAQTLSDAYLFLRHTENAIQLLHNQQTHLIPTDEINQQCLMDLLECDDWAVWVDKLNQHRNNVSEQFTQLFSQYGAHIAQDEIQWPEHLSDAAKHIVDDWEEGMLVYGAPLAMREKLTSLLFRLAQFINEASSANEVGESAQTSSDVVLRLHDFFRSLPQGGQYLRLLAESPKLLESIIPPLLFSPPMTTLLKQSPHIVDCYMAPAWDWAKDGFDSDYVLQANHYEERLERLRRFVNESLYQLYLQFMQGVLSVSSFQQGLTQLAIHTLDCTLTLVTQHMQLDQPAVSVVGMGKVATGRMSPMSDLDLIFVFDQNKVSMDLASRFVTRLQTAIATPMREGIVYELDTRLRPSGRSGAPTVSTDSFQNHHFERAHTWEHIALVSSRILLGDDSTVESVRNIKQSVLSRSRDQQQFIKDAIKMWQRVSEHRIEDVPLTAMFNKLRPGGLMQAEYLAACLIIQSSSRHLIASNQNYDTLLIAASQQANISDLPDIIQFWRIQQLWERLLGKTKQPLQSIPEPYLSHLLEQSGVTSIAELTEKKQQFSAQVVAAMDALFEEHAMESTEIDQWLETSVRWLSS